MYRHHAPTRPLSTQLDPIGTDFPLTEFGVSHPNQDFRPATKSDSMPSPEEGLSAKDETILRLSRLEPENESQKERRGILLGELGEVLEQIAALTEEVTTDRTARLTAAHKQVRKAGRLAEEAQQKAADAYSAADIFALNMIEVQTQARQNLEHLHDLEERGVHLRRFHSDQELADWKQKYKEYQDLVVAGNQMAQDAVGERKLRQEELTAAREEVGRLAAIESRLRSELRGTAYWDPELGLGEPGASRMTPELSDAMARRDE